MKNEPEDKEQIKQEENIDAMTEERAENEDEVVENETATEDSSENQGSQEVDESTEVEKLKDEVGEAKDKYLRLYSEFENFRRRTAKEKIDLVKTGNEDLVLALIPVIDDFERALNNITDDSTVESLQEGIHLIHQKFVKALDQKGVKKIDTGKGADFDDDIHEAITQIPAPDKKLKGKIVDVVESGYKLGDKVIRFAKVVTGA